MHLAALVDLGVPKDWLLGELARLALRSEFKIDLQPGNKMGISGTQVWVHAEDKQNDHRHHSTIVRIIKQAEYPSAVEARALAMFHAIAVSEAKIHDIDIEAVHFHEVGAIDSIVDIVAAALAIEYFQPEHILCSPIEVGSGYVDCAHGRFPVPAPATQELLQGAPCTYGTVSGESTTPTGAAILATNVTEFAPKGTFSMEKTGYGIGHKDFEVPNVIRVALGNYTPKATRMPTEHVKLEANIDDMTPEAFEPLASALYSAGAVDVYFTPIIMKKSRPAQMVSVLCATHEQFEVSAALLNNSTTIGLRTFPFTKTVLPREELTLTTSLGDIRVKRVTQPNGQSRWKTEHDDVLSAANRASMDYPTAKRVIDREVTTQLDP